MQNYIVAAFYQFIDWDDLETKQQDLKAFCDAREMKGTMLIANEGINGTVCGSREAITEFHDFLVTDFGLDSLEYKESSATQMPFKRMKVKIKKEIVTLGQPDIRPAQYKGKYVTPDQWNDLISDEDVLVIDTRNDYEFEVGSFKGAVNPNTNAFRDLPDFVAKELDPKKHKKVAMFCTGGIRCEKSTAYLLNQGFEEVYHLKGGILQYLEDVPADETLWQGHCFVFDDRVAVNHDLSEGEYDQCHACRYPITAQDKESDKYIKGVSCPRCHDETSDEKKARFAERQKQMELAAARGECHIGMTLPRHQKEHT